MSRIVQCHNIMVTYSKKTIHESCYQLSLKYLPIEYMALVMRGIFAGKPYHSFGFTKTLVTVLKLLFHNNLYLFPL